VVRQWCDNGTMATNIRLSPALDSRVRGYCEEVGISLNALVSIALDLYLRTPDEPSEPAAQRESVAPIPQPENIPEPVKRVSHKAPRQFTSVPLSLPKPAPEPKPKHPGPRASFKQLKAHAAAVTLWQAANPS
jgi:outer membrane biosynthesis protein TonB